MHAPRVAVRPPEYFPRLRYMALLQHVDHFILADTFPYRRKSFQDRSKVRSPQGWHWITIPIFGQRDGAPLQDVSIRTEGRWFEKHWRSFLYNYRSTPYFEFFEASFQPFFEKTWAQLSACTSRSVEVAAELFGLQTPVTRASALEGTPETLPDVLRSVSGGTLVTPTELGPEAVPNAVDVQYVDVQYFAYEHPTYRQNFEGFESGMSAVDLVFNYGREAQRILARGAAIASAPPGSPPGAPGAGPDR